MHPEGNTHTSTTTAGIKLPVHRAAETLEIKEVMDHKDSVITTLKDGKVKSQ